MGARRLMGAASVFSGTGAIVASTAERLTGVTSEKWKHSKDQLHQIIKKTQH